MSDPRADDHCVTCADEAVEMQVLDLNGQLARCVDDAGEGHDVMTDLVTDVVPGDTLLVHAGAALSRVAETFEDVPR